ncbi:lipid A deacylase LpxR family protein [Phenylobacterium sp.]|uniref:lipid A deacylase LpxR family protein n=1 Tax=Phenylobacterium sp. TaxID=1871053 RepID=UPI0028120953|nr:lipid A deacylase LpxR family protein [Phenylobacterium sp.]
MRRPGFRAALCAAALVGAAAGPALGQDANDEDDWVATLQVENEFFIPGKNDDRYYTQGLQLNVLTPSRSSPIAGRARELPFLDPNASYRGGFVIGQNIYTPEDLTLPEPDPKDRPYAGWLYVGGEVMTYSEKRLDSLQLQVGVVGPQALGGWTQNNWHKHVNHIDEAQGWKHQLKNEVAFVLYGERRWRPIELWPRPRAGQDGRGERTEGLSVDFTPAANVALGTVQVSGGLGGTLRVGTHLAEDYGAPRIRPAPSGSSFFGPSNEFAWYAYAGTEVKGVARDIFLDGNTFKDSRRVDKRPWVQEFQAGVVARIWRLRVTYANVWRTEEFLGQNGDSHFAAVTVGFSTGLLARPR